MRKLTFGSLFTGVGGFDMGFEAAGMECLWQVEIDGDCQTVLGARFSKISKFYDITKCGGQGSGRENVLARVDVICGGFPCQDLSVAGRRAGLAGERSGLWYEFLRVVTELLPSIVVIENVPGLLSSWCPVEPPPCEISPRDFDSEGEAQRWSRSMARDWDVDEGSDFETLLLGLQDLGFGLGWTVLDSQYRGVAQRRERVFVVGGLGEGNGSGTIGSPPLEELRRFRGLPAEILFEPESLRGDSAPSRGKGPGTPRDVAACLNSGGHDGGFRSEPGEYVTTAYGGGNSEEIDVSTCLTRHGNRQDFDTETFLVGGSAEITGTLAHNGKAAGSATQQDAENGFLVTTPLRAQSQSAHDESLETYIPVAFKPSHFTRGKDGAPSEVCPPLSADADKGDQDPLVLCRNGSDIQISDKPGALGTNIQGSGDCVAYDERQVTSKGNYSNPKLGDPCHPLNAGSTGPVLAFSSKDHGRDASDDISPTLRAMPSGPGVRPSGGGQVAVAFQERGREGGRSLETLEEQSYALLNPGDGSRSQEKNILDPRNAVRRLTPRECARLQAFPDNWNEMLCDSARYKQFGNAVTTSVAKWIGERIVAVLGPELVKRA